MTKLRQRVATTLAASRLKPVAVLVVRGLPRPVFAAARRFRVDDRATRGLFTEATSALREGKHRPGRALAQVLLSYAPLTSRQRGILHRELGRLHHEEQRHEEAVTNLTSAVAQLPSDKGAAELLVRAAVATDDPMILEKALPNARLSDLEPDPLNDAFTILAEAGDWRTILATVDEDELGESTLLHIAALADRLAEPDVDAEVSKLVQTELDSARIWFERGRRLESDGQLDRALAAYEEALRKPNPNAATWYRAGRLHLRVGDATTAEGHLAEAVRLKPHRARWRSAFGRALLAVSRHPEAVKELSRALELAPKQEQRHAVTLARARRKAGLAAPGIQQEPPTPPSIEDLRDVDVGIAAPMTAHVAVGWLLDLPGADREVDIEVNGLWVARARASTPVTLADGRTYLKFQRTIRELWSFLGEGDVVQITVGDEPLHIIGMGDRIVIDLERPSCVAGLERQLERRYVINKRGRVRRSIRHNLRWQHAAVELFRELRSDVRDAIGVELFPFYGTLLGAIREQNFLGHDDDFDTAYISSSTSPTEVHAEFERLCDHLIRKGHQIEVRPWHIRVKIPTTRRRLDISFCWFDEQDRFQAGYGYHGEATQRSEAFRLDRIVRLGPYELVAPSNAEELLAQLYGPGWREPDPSFSHYSSTRVQDLRYRISLALRYEVYWRQFYREHKAAGGSTFVEWVAERSPPPGRLIEFECGSGRDIIDFAKRGYEVIASDSSQKALARATEVNRVASLRRPATFCAIDVSDADAVKRCLDRTTEDLPDNRELVVCLRVGEYSVLASLPSQLLEGLSNSLNRDFTLCLESRKVEDRSNGNADGDRGDASATHEELIAQLAAYWGFQIEHVEATESRFSFRGEQPHIARIVARREPRRQT